ncbi:3-methyladenine DNA glycosylase [Gaertneriomyces sp. JEL0708]|nr:3-methyladenine DNA glycosylase [Gaertneriomyces sp. JEL0708]
MTDIDDKIEPKMLTRSQAKLLARAAPTAPPLAGFRVKKRASSSAASKTTGTTKRTKLEDRGIDESVSVKAEVSFIDEVAAAVAAPTAALPSAQAPFDFQTAMSEICKKDPKLAEVIQKTGKPCKIFEEVKDDGQELNAFKALATAIIHQQLHGKAAATIERRFIDLFQGNEVETSSTTRTFPTPKQARAADRQTLRSVGLSERKAEYIHCLADRFIDGTITNEKLLNMADEELSQLLCSIKGIGPWTVDMFLMFDLKRPNILPVGDLGVRKGMAIHFGLKGTAKGKKNDLPSPEQMRTAATIWEPYRTIGSYYMWALMDIKTVKDSEE